MPRRRPVAPGTCDVLLVGSGNICRSAMAASMLAYAFPQLTVASAGVAAIKGQLPHAMACLALAQRKVPVQNHQARPLTATLADGAELIITMTTGQKEAVEALGAEAFTVTELAAWLEDGDHGTPADLAALAGKRRAGADGPAPATPDITDPYGRELSAYQRCFDELGDGLRPLAKALAS